MIYKIVHIFGLVDMTYEDAQEEFDLTINKDKITGAFARLFCDYIVSILGLLPVFFPISMWLKDRVTKSYELTYI